MIDISLIMVVNLGGGGERCTHMLKIGTVPKTDMQYTNLGCVVGGYINCSNRVYGKSTVHNAVHANCSIVVITGFL